MTPLSVTSAALKYAPWSFSKVETADSCPAQFKHKHVLRTEAGPKTSDTLVGTAAHKVLERRVTGGSHYDATKEAVAETPLTAQEMDQLRSLEERMETFLRKWDRFCREQGVTKLFVEAEWAFTAEFEPTTFWAKDAFFRGKVDLGALTRDRDLVVIDHKSGVAKNLAFDTKKKQQLQAYASLALASVPGIAGVRGGIHFMQGDPEKAIQWVKYADAARVRDVFVPWLFTRLCESAEALVEPFQAKPARKMPRGWPCHWCEYQAACPEFQELHGGKEG